MRVQSRQVLTLLVGHKKSLLFIFSSAAPQRTAYSEVPSQMAARVATKVGFHNFAKFIGTNFAKFRQGIQFREIL
jgi:hypothetical protein